MHPNDGEVTIQLSGRPTVLRPSLRAATAISNKFGGYVPAMQAVVNLEIGAFAYIVHFGMGRKDGEPRDLLGQIWESGMSDMQAELVSYISMLSNGGRPRRDEDEQGEDGDSGNEP